MAHNLGAVAVVGGPAAAWLLIRVNQAPRRLDSAETGDSSATAETVQRGLAWFAILAWSAQTASGAAFGATTYYLKSHLPELSGVAFAALGVKAGCALAGFSLALFYLRAASRWPAHMKLVAWQILFALGLTALMAAAVLRWYG
jgi:hypothetical protein